MEGKRQSQRSAQWLAATSAPIVTTVLLALAGVRSTTAGMVYLVVVVWTATQSGLVISLCSALLCAISFDYFFLSPVHTFTLAGPQEYVSMLAFAASSLVAGRVAERARKQKEEAERRREDVEALYRLTQEMMLREDATGLVRDLPRMMEQILGLESAVLYVRDREELVSSESDLTALFRATMQELATGAHMGVVMQDGFEAHALMLGMRPVGALAWKPAVLSRELRTALCAQVAIALTRAIAIEANARMEALRESERLRAALIDSLTHDLKTPLTSIRAAATALTQSDGIDDALRRELASVVDEESAHLDALIGEAVEIAEIDANVVEVQPTQQRARTLLDHAVADSKKVIGRHHVVMMVQEPDTPVWYDAKLLGRAFRHLIENAAQYSPAESRIVLRSRRVDGRLEFEVEDSGPGIDKGDLPHIFDKSYRGSQGAKRGKGTGMGLAITRAIVRAHGGDVAVESSAEHGSTFRFWVPLR